MSEPAASGLWQALAPWTSTDAINKWFSRTTWWVGPHSLKSQQQMLQELLEAIAGRFLGQELTLDVRGRQVTFTLGEVRVVTDSRTATFNPLLWWTELPGAREMLRWTRTAPAPPSVERVHVDTSALSIDAHDVGDVAATVDGLHLEFGAMTSELVTGAVDLEVTATRATALEWVRTALPEWHLDLRDHGRIAARHQRWPVTLVGRPELLGTTAVRVHVEGVELRGRSVRLPKRFIRQRTFELPAVSDEFDVTGMELADDTVRVRLRHRGVRQPVRPEHVRAAIREGMTTFGSKVFSSR